MINRHDFMHVIFNLTIVSITRELYSIVMTRVSTHDISSKPILFNSYFINSIFTHNTSILREIFCYLPLLKMLGISKHI